MEKDKQAVKELAQKVVEESVKPQDWCHFCLRVGYDDVKRWNDSHYSLCGYCRGKLMEIME